MFVFNEYNVSYLIIDYHYAYSASNQKFIQTTFKKSDKNASNFIENPEEIFSSITN